MPRFALDACRVHVTMKAPDHDAAIAWGVRNLKVPPDLITAKELPDETPPSDGHNTPANMKKKSTKKGAKSATNKPAKDASTAAEKIVTAMKKVFAEAKAEGRRMADAANATGRPDQRRKAPKDGMSGLDAAADVLKRSKEPLNAKQIVACIQNDGLCPTLKGKTPHATIYAAMITEMSKKGDASRFARGKEKGTFVYNDPQDPNA